MPAYTKVNLSLSIHAVKKLLPYMQSVVCRFMMNPDLLIIRDLVNHLNLQPMQSPGLMFSLS